MKKPNLFIIGPGRSGTTALYNYLKQHPEIYFPKQKELHHFAKDINEKRLNFHKKIDSYWNYTFEEYINHFKKVKNEKVIGDATPGYIYSEVAANEIYKFNPAAKIVVTFREPIEMLSSIHALRGFNLMEDKNFEEALKLDPARKKGKYLPNTKRQIPPCLLFYSERITYAKCLQRYLKIFPKENIKIILFDDFKKDTAQVVKDLLLFLEVDSEFKFNIKPHHVNKVVKHKKLKEIIYSTPAQACKEIFPKSIRQKIVRVIYKLTAKEEKRKPLDPEFKKQLMKKYKPEVVKINNLLHKHELIEKDLVKLWGYDFPMGALNQK